MEIMNTGSPLIMSLFTSADFYSFTDSLALQSMYAIYDLLYCLY